VQGNAGDNDTWVEEQRRFQVEGRLVVQDMLPPSGNDKFGQDHRQRITGEEFVICRNSLSSGSMCTPSSLPTCRLFAAKQSQKHRYALVDKLMNKA